MFSRDHVRANLLSYTRRAYDLLPKLDRPRILDIGCGSGVSTLEIAQISGGSLVAVDTDRHALDELADRFRQTNLVHRLEIIHTSMQELAFPPNSFDVIWSEGSIVNIGFKRGLSEWRDFLIPEGHLVVHDVMTDLPRKMELARVCGYKLLGLLKLSPEIWWSRYYEPLKKELEAFQQTCSLSKKVMAEMKVAEREIKEFDHSDDRFGSVFFVLQKQ